LIAQGTLPIASNSPSSSGASGKDAPGVGSVAQSQLCEGLSKALFWIGWGVENLRDRVAEVLDDFLCQVEDMMKERRSLSEGFVTWAESAHKI
jgi:hypothetical protein